jgi:hypothetical protein
VSQAPPLPAARIAGRDFAFLGLYLSVGTIVAVLNRFHVEQQTNFWSQYVSMADHYRGLEVREVLTYPTWGYPMLLMALPDYSHVTVVQVLLGTLALWLVYLACTTVLPGKQRLLGVLLLLAWPWYSLHSVKWPLSISASLVAFAILALWYGIRHNSARSQGLAGVLLGLAFYFRSEVLLIPPFLLVAAIAFRSLRGTGPVLALRPLLMLWAISWIMLVPWVVHYKQQTGRFSPTASQGGTVALISLGQLPNNPWGITYEDEYAFAVLERTGLGVPLNSDEANRALMSEFLEQVRAHPGAFMRKVSWNAATSLLGGFYAFETPLSREERAQFDEAWAQLKRDLTLRESTSTDRLASSTRVKWAVVLHFASKALGGLFLLVSFGALLAWLIIPGHRPLLLQLAAAMLLYQWLLSAFLTAEPRYMNGLYIYCVPIIAGAWVNARRSSSDSPPAARPSA